MEAETVTSVSQLELFFDLVFVFTVTQLTSVLVVHTSWSRLWHAVVMLALIFWMYDGYAWLTNAVPTRGARRQGLLLAGMAGYLVAAIAIPRAFEGAGLTFGLAYLAINAIHAFLYVTSADVSSAAAMRALAPWNLTTAVAVVVSGAIGGTVEAVVWTAVALALWFGSRPSEGFEIGPAHFVERHSLLVLIAIGESVVAAGIGAHGRVTAALVGVTLLGLMVSAGLWLTYFGEETERLEHAFRSLRGLDRVRAAFYGFGRAHFLMLLAIIFTSVGVRHAVAHPGSGLGLPRASLLSGGVALFLAADGWFRAALRVRPARRRIVGATAVLLAVPVGVLAGAAGLAATAAILATVLTLEHRARAAEAAE